MKILISGGHVTPAIAVAAELKKTPDNKIYFVGRKYMGADDKQLSMEYRTVSKAKGIKFYHLVTGRLTRLFNISSIVEFIKIPFGFVHALLLIVVIRPDVVISFGGYIALPLAFWGKIFGAKILTHEQTISPGLANRIIAKFAQRICISFKQTEKHFNTKKVILTGNPIREDVFLQNPDNNIFPKTIPQKPILYITGGSLGSHSLNVHTERILDHLLKDFFIIHQCGNVAPYFDWQRLKQKKSAHYIAMINIADRDIGFVLAKASLVVCRAGANTVLELIALKKPAVLVPLPWSAGNEQLFQAKIMKSAGVAEIFNQEDKSDNLLRMINSVYANRKKHIAGYSNLTDIYKKDSAKKIAAIVGSL